MRFIPVLLILAFALAFGGCSGPVDDEILIRARVAEMGAAAETKAIQTLLKPVHKTFLGNKQLRKANLRGRIRWYFQRHKNVHILINDLEVVLDEKDAHQATVRFNLVLAGRNQTLPETARAYKVESRWHKDDDEWFVMSATW